MASDPYEAIPDVAISETSHMSAMLGFGALAIVLFAGFAYATYLRKKAERDGIYTKYKLPDDPQKARR